MQTELTGELSEFHEKMLIAVDMIENLEDRKMVYAVMVAAEKAHLYRHNPRKVFLAHSDEFPHIKLDMSYRDWNV